MEHPVTVHPGHEPAAEERTRLGRTLVPAVDIADADEALWLWADMPGVDERSIEVRLDNGVLSIEGRVPADDSANLEPVYTEYNVGSFERRFRLSDVVDTDGIRATVTCSSYGSPRRRASDAGASR